MQRKIDEILRLSALAAGWESAEDAAPGASQLDAAARWFLERPELLDGHLETALAPLLTHAAGDVARGEITRPWVYHMLYSLLDVRGRAGTEQFLPKDVSQLEPTLRTLEAWMQRGRDAVAEAGRGDAFIAAREEGEAGPGFSQVNTRTFSSDLAFRVTYCLLTFLRTLLSVPFDISSVSTRPSLAAVLAAGEAGAAAPTGPQAPAGIDGTFEYSLYSLLKPCLYSSGRAQFLAAEILARFSTRPDERGVFLPRLLDDFNGVLGRYLRFETVPRGGSVGGQSGSPAAVPAVSAPPALSVAAASPAPPTAQEACGALTALCYVARYGDREHTIGLSASILRSPEAALRRLLGDRNREVRRLSLVLSTRLAALHLRAPFQWSVRQNLNSLEELRGFSVPPEFDFYVDSLLLGLADRDGSLRSSSARCLATIVQKLPKLFADEVIDAVLSYLSPAETVEAWHGAMLAVAELVRRRLLLQERLLQVFPFLLQALRFDRVSSASSSPSIVRDTACYAVWALARAYSDGGATFEVAEALARELLVLACFDREINIRRAAAAAFQELAGRVREPFVPSAVLCAAAVDYFELGSLSNAYLSVSLRVARQNRGYAEALLSALAERYLGHPSPEVRSLAARAIVAVVRVYLGADGSVERGAQGIQETQGVGVSEAGVSAAPAPEGAALAVSAISAALPAPGDAAERTAFVAAYVADLALDLQHLDRRDDWMRHSGVCLAFAELLGSCGLLCSIGAGESLRGVLADEAVFAPGLPFADNAEANSHILGSAGRLLLSVCENLGPAVAGAGGDGGEGVGPAALRLRALAASGTYFAFLRSVFNAAVLAALGRASIVDIDVFFRAPVVSATAALLRWALDALPGLEAELGAGAPGEGRADLEAALAAVRELAGLDFLAVEFETKIARSAFLAALPPQVALREREKLLAAYVAEAEPPLTSAAYPNRIYCVRGCWNLVQCVAGEAVDGVPVRGEASPAAALPGKAGNATLADRVEPAGHAEPAPLSREQEAGVLRVFEACLNDYTSDIRGDVGALVRLHTIRTLRGALLAYSAPAGGQTPAEAASSLVAALGALYQQYLVQYLGSRQALFRAEMLDNLAGDIASGACAIAEVPEEEICAECEYVASAVARARAAAAERAGAGNGPEGAEGRGAEPEHLFDLHAKGAGEDGDPGGPADGPVGDPPDGPAGDPAVSGADGPDSAAQGQFALAATSPLPQEDSASLPAMQAVRLLLRCFLPRSRFQAGAAEALIFCAGFRGDPAALYVSALLRESRAQPGRGWDFDLFFGRINAFAGSIPPGNYAAMFAASSALFLEDMISNGVFPEADEDFSRLISSLTLLLKAKNYASFYSHVITALSAAACALAPERTRYPGAFARAVRGLLVRLSAKVVKHRNGAAEGLAELVAYWPEVLVPGPGGERDPGRALGLLLQRDWACMAPAELDPLRAEVCALLGFEAPGRRGGG